MTNEERIAALEKRVEDQAGEIALLAAALDGTQADVAAVSDALSMRVTSSMPDAAAKLAVRALGEAESG